MNTIRRALPVRVAPLAAGAVLLVTFATPAGADRITLPTGETLVVEVIESTEKGLKVKHSVLGELEIPRDGITLVTDAGQPLEVPPPPPPPSPWTFSLAAGGGLTAGNTENAMVNAMFSAHFDGGTTRFTYDAGYFYANDGSEDTENRFTTGVLSEFDITERWFWGLQARFDYDDFQSWRYRVTGHAFTGYRIFTEDPFTLNGRIGLGFLKEFDSNNEDWQLEGLLGLDGKWTLSENSAIVWDTTYFPALTNMPEFRWVTNVGWTTVLDKKHNLNFLIALQHEYQSDVDVDREHNDFRLTFNIQANW